jgi:endonuclease/exonuclease/phosphatase (EEP) superfamily protein YafD
MFNALRVPLHVGRLALITLSWAVVAGLAVVSAFHLAHREPWTDMVGLIAVTPWIYMLAWVSAAIGLFTRHRLLVGVSVVLVGLQLWWVVPDFDPISHLVMLPKGAVEVRLFDANVSWTNYNLTEIAGEIRSDHAQVVTLEEPNGTALASLQKTGVLSRFHYDLVRTNGGDDGMALYSVFPLEDATVWYAGAHPEFRAWLKLPGVRRLRIDVIHVHAPVGGPEPALWAGQMNAARKELAHEPRPLVAMGDFNATWYDWHFQALLQLGLRDAAVVAGQGWRMTYPRNQSPVVPYVRIDHVLISAGVSLEGYGVGRGQGSEEHQPIMATVSVGGELSHQLLPALGYAWHNRSLLPA